MFRDCESIAWPSLNKCSYIKTTSALEENKKALKRQPGLPALCERRLYSWPITEDRIRGCSGCCGEGSESGRGDEWHELAEDSGG